MAKNRKNQAAAIRFGPALKALFLCLLIAGSALGFVWQKSQVYQLGRQIHEKESRLVQLQRDNERLDSQLNYLGSPVKLDLQARSLGLGPGRPEQVVRLAELPPASPDDKSPLRQLATRPAGVTPR
jgi:cell division protein FtsL